MPKKPKPTVNPVLAREDQIALALKKAQENYAIPVPTPVYRYQVGQSVQLGHLVDVRVEEVLDDGKFIMLSHHNKGRAGGIDYDNGRKQFGIKPWYELAPLVGVSSQNFMRPRKGLTFRSSTLSDTLGLLEREGIQDSPDYQRGHVWTESDKVRLIASLMNRSDIGKLVLVELDSNEGFRYEILDGKQRLNALREFITGGFKYCRHYYWELTTQDRSEFENTIVPVAQISNHELTRVEKLELFLNVNAAGVAQTEEHLNHVRRLLTKAKAEAG